MVKIVEEIKDFVKCGIIVFATLYGFVLLFLNWAIGVMLLGMVSLIILFEVGFLKKKTVKEMNIDSYQIVFAIVLVLFVIVSIPMTCWRCVIDTIKPPHTDGFYVIRVLNMTTNTTARLREEGYFNYMRAYRQAEEFNEWFEYAGISDRIYIVVNLTNENYEWLKEFM